MSNNILIIDGIELRQIPDFSAYYISDDGRIYSTKRNRFMKPCPNPDGYLHTTLTRDDGKHKCVDVHRAVMWAWGPEQPEGTEVMHLDGNPQNNYIGNLAYGTHAENMKEPIRCGRLSVSETDYNARDGIREKRSEESKKGWAKRKAKETETETATESVTETETETESA